MNRRKSERFDSTVEVGELKLYEESMEGSESSERWTVIGKQSECSDIPNTVNETVADSIAIHCVAQGAWQEDSLARS